MLEGEGYRVLDKVLPFVVVLIDRGTEHEQTTSLTKCYTLYGEIKLNQNDGQGQQAWIENKLQILH